MSRALHVSPDLQLPLEAATETFGLLAVRGAGKSNAARVLAEEMFDAHIPFVAIDPFGSWWGLRASRDGKLAGLSIPIFGGRHGDVPLERGGGQLIADLIVDQRLSCVLDLSRFESETAKRGFLLDFARRLFERNEEPLHLFLEEADDYIPQKPMREEAQLIRAWQNIVRRGRSRGLGMTLITQRSASVSKEVLTQVQTLIAMRTTGPHDTAAIEGWLKYHGQSREILASLAGLEDGEAWVWSPHFLKRTARVRFRLSLTYDSGATPKMQKASRAPATLADIDLGAIKGRMADTIERAKAEDPRELQRRVRELERELATANARPAAAPAASGKPAREVPVLKDAQVKRLEVAVQRARDACATLLTRHADQVDKLSQRLQVVVSTVGELARSIEKAPAPPIGRFGAAGELVITRPAPSRPQPPRQPARPAGDGAAGLPKAQQRILDAIAWLEAIGIRAPDKTQVSLFADLTPSAGHTTSSFGALRTAGLIDYPTPGTVGATASGRLKGQAGTVPQSAPDLHRQVLGKLPSAQRRILEVLIEAYPAVLDKDAVSKAAGLVPGAGHTTSSYGRLRSLGLIDYPTPRQVVALPVLFLEGR